MLEDHGCDAVLITDFREGQAEVEYRQKLRRPRRIFHVEEDADEMLVSIVPRDGSAQKVVPKVFLESVLTLAHYLQCGGRPVREKMFNLLHHTFLWPRMSLDFSGFASKCPSCDCRA